MTSFSCLSKAVFATIVEGATHLATNSKTYHTICFQRPSVANPGRYAYKVVSYHEGTNSWISTDWIPWEYDPEDYLKIDIDKPIPWTLGYSHAYYYGRFPNEYSKTHPLDQQFYCPVTEWEKGQKYFNPLIDWSGWLKGAWDCLYEYACDTENRAENYPSVDQVSSLQIHWTVNKELQKKLVFAVAAPDLKITRPEGPLPPAHLIAVAENYVVQNFMPDIQRQGSISLYSLFNGSQEYLSVFMHTKNP